MTSTMRAALLTAPGRALELRNIHVPRPGPDELLVNQASRIWPVVDSDGSGVRTVRSSPPSSTGLLLLWRIHLRSQIGADRRARVEKCHRSQA